MSRPESPRAGCSNHRTTEAGFQSLISVLYSPSTAPLGCIADFHTTMRHFSHRVNLYRETIRPPENNCMSYQPIEDYGIIGNMRTVALVGMNGSIDWHCSPNFDSPSVFGALLDDAKGGRFQIAPIADQVRRKQFYWPSTNILVTRFSHEDGIAELEDFMPVGFAADSASYHQLHRRVRCVRGTVRLYVTCRPAFDYGRASHQVQVRDGVAIFNAGNNRDHFSLATDVPLKFQDDGGVSAEFVLEEGQSKTFIFQNDDGKGTPAAIPASEAEAKEPFERPVKFWQDWIGRCTL